MWRIFFLLLFGGWLISCEKELDIEPKDAGEVLVVEASIEFGQPPRVLLTRSFKYFSTITLDQVANAFVTGATVTISDGAITQQLREYEIPAGGGKIIVYSADTALGFGQLRGKLNTAYSLSIVANGKTYTAKTTIPDLSRTIDSIWWQKAPNNDDTNKVVLFGRFTDPVGRGHYIRYYTSTNDSAFLPGLNSVFDDALVDGTTYEIQVDRGVDRNQELDIDEYGFFKRGDTITLRLSNINKNTYDFWRTWEQNQSNLGNPFAVPVKVLGNISNGALGYFGGYASQEKLLVVPE